MTAVAAAVVIEGLDVVRGSTHALRHVSASIETGRVTGLLGPSGSGKTTLIRAIVGVQIVRRGRVSVLGEPGLVTRDAGIVAGVTVVALALAAATLRRRTP